MSSLIQGIGRYKKMEKLLKAEDNDNFVSHPLHYGGKENPYEAIKIIEAYDLNFHLGNAIKYILRAGKKTDSPSQDLEKAVWYLQRHLENISKDQNADTNSY